MVAFVGDAGETTPIAGEAPPIISSGSTTCAGSGGVRLWVVGEGCRRGDGERDRGGDGSFGGTTWAVGGGWKCERC